MTHALLAALPCFATARPSAANRPRQEANPKTQKRNHKANGGTRTSTSTSVGFSRERKDPLWQCVQGCGACCKLEKGPTFPSPEEVFDDPSDIQKNSLDIARVQQSYQSKDLVNTRYDSRTVACKLYKSLIGPDGWCVNYEKETRTCAIYAGDFLPG
ncbi:hypothetical protein RJ640_024220 [Escallonia rubra]|uniref:YkgJ family cysteine cluster protein n=1 Tax=Escallonia rubra TaxID=112253 RepID=A0AA88RJL8_9ASTE|nr:hypothetical protein RJ640_024220 [Escallonia rubra]